MPDVSPAARVYSPQLMGEATVLGSGLGPLRVAMQMDALNRRKEIAAAKAKADAEKLQVMPELDMKGGNLFQHQVDASAQDVYDKIKNAYATKPLPEARAISAKLKAGHNGLVAHTVDADAIYRKQLADAPARFLDPAAVKGGLDEALIDPATGKADIARFDEAKFPKFEADPKYYNRTAVTEDFAKKAMQEQSASFATASRPGVSGETNSASSNYYATPPSGKFLFNKDGSMVPRDLPGLTELAMGYPKMAAMLAEKHAQDVANGVAINNGTDRINLDQLVRPLATAKRGYQQNNPMAIPQGPAGGKAKASDIVPDNGVTTTAAIGGSDAVPASGRVPAPFGVPVGGGVTGRNEQPLLMGNRRDATVPVGATSTNGIQTLRLGNAPVRRDGKQVTVEGLPVRSLERRKDGGGDFEDVNNNAEGFNGVLGPYFHAAIDPKTKMRLKGLSAAEQGKRVANGTADMGMFIQGTSSNGKDFIRDRDAYFNQYKKERDDADLYPGSAGYKPDSELRDRAAKQAQTGSEPVLLHYDEQSATAIDGPTQKYYRAGYKAAAELQARLRAAHPASTNAGAYQKKSSATTPPRAKPGTAGAY